VRVGLAVHPQAEVAVGVLEADHLGGAGAQEALHLGAVEALEVERLRQVLHLGQRNEARQGLLEAAVRVLDEVLEARLELGEAGAIDRHQELAVGAEHTGVPGQRHLDDGRRPVAADRAARQRLAIEHQAALDRTLTASASW
jgi:hypothetical protein